MDRYTETYVFTSAAVVPCACELFVVVAVVANEFSLFFMEYILFYFFFLFDWIVQCIRKRIL